MNKPKKRYENPQQIQEKIRDKRSEVKNHLINSDRLEHEADHMIRSGMPGAASLRRKEAQKRRKTAYRIENKTIPKLIQKLGELSTELLPGVITDGDRSIPVR